MRHRLAAAVALSTLAACNPPSPASQSPPSPVERGRYLAAFGGCNDCHTPKVFTATGPQLDTARLLSGHPAGAPVPAIPAGAMTPTGWAVLTTGDLTAWAGPWGVAFAANLTPDATGLGAWTPEGFVQTMRTGKHLGVGRPLLPAMPWQSVGHLTDDDLTALFAYLHSLKAIANAVPGPVPPQGAKRGGKP